MTSSSRMKWRLFSARTCKQWKHRKLTQERRHHHHHHHHSESRSYERWFLSSPVYRRPPPSEKNREKSLFSRFFSEGGGRLYTGYPIRHHGRKLLPVDSKISCISYLGTSFSFSEEAGPLGLHRKSRPLFVRNDPRIEDGVLAAVRLTGGHTVKLLARRVLWPVDVFWHVGVKQEHI